MAVGQVKWIQERWRIFCRIALTRVYRLLLMSFLSISSMLVIAAPVLAAPAVVPSSLPTGQIGVSYYGAVMASGGTPPYTWSLALGTLPPGLTLAPTTGIISGVPVVQGTFSFAAKVTDSTAASAQQAFFITITSRPITFLNYGLPQATEGTNFTASLGASGGTYPYTWYIASGALPSGLFLDTSSGTISGMPARGTAGTSSFTVSVSDSSAPPATAQQTFSITVARGSFQPIVTVSSGLKAGGTKVMVNGQQVATLQGGQSTKLNFDLGTSQTISVDPIVQHPSKDGIRFKVDTDRITVNDYTTSADFNYSAEYYVELHNEPASVGQVNVSGWYREDYPLHSTAPDKVDSDSRPGTQYRFTYWKLPAGDTSSDRNLNFSVNAPGIITANYDTYYRLSFTSPYGEQKAATWYKAGTTADWNLANNQVAMTGILGFFGGKLNAVNSGGTSVMDEPKSITVSWEPDYTMPFIFIPLALLVLILVIYGLYALLRSPHPRPATVIPVPLQQMPPAWLYPPMSPFQPTHFPVFPTMRSLPYAPLPPQQSPIIINRDSSTQTTKEQLMKLFGELLDKYEMEIKASLPAATTPKIETVKEEKKLPPQR